MEKKERNVFLFGAGAALSWGGPTTNDLTDVVLSSGFKLPDNKTTITKFIYDHLLSKGYSATDVNFETVINVIEELISYFARFSIYKKMPSLLKCFFELDCDRDFLNFSIKGGLEQHNFQLEIPANVEYAFSNYAQHNETPEQFFLEHLISVIITDINIRIERYANHCKNDSHIDKNSEVSQKFIKWMRNNSRHGILRMYTLNYDRLFKILLEAQDLEIFEGFDCGEFIDYGVHLRTNVTRVLSDFNTHTHYNLHGSAFWEVLALDSEQLPNPEFLLTSNVSLPVNDDFAMTQIEKGRNVMLTNIVTGYQKAQKTLVTPLKQMQSAFDRDCLFADNIFIVGYSLGDEHINESIKTALRHNRNVKITIVDPSFSKNNTDYEAALKIFPYKGGFSLPKTLRPDVHSFLDGTIIAHTVTFERFLEKELNPFMKDGFGNYV